MPIVVVDPLGERGKRDAKRHREKLYETIKKKLPEVIGEETIITGSHDKTVKIPIRGLQIPVFRPKRSDEEAGIGQGPGNVGDEASGEDGEEAYPEHEIETEVPMEELIELMFQDLGLPNLKEKNIREIEVELSWKIKGLTRVGPQSRLHRNRTKEAGMKRFNNYLYALMNETGADNLVCFRALKQADGVLQDALKLVQNPELITDTSDQVAAWPIILEEDQRYHNLKKATAPQSNAVLIAMMDVSGSMDDMKKYLARSLLFWLVGFLRHQYKNVAVRFIIHDSEAQIVDEERFFHTREGGYTACVSAYEAAESLIESTYPPDAWNIYIWHFSDGEDFKPKEAVEVIQRLIPKVNMIGYGEVQPSFDIAAALKTLFGPKKGDSTDLWETLKLGLSAEEKIRDGLKILSGVHVPFLGILIADRQHIYPAIREFLKRDRWAE